MRMHWNRVLEMHGIGFGYTNHQRMLRKHCEEQGVVMDESADIAVQIVPAGNYEPVPGKFNVLYTMYEATTIPEKWKRKVKEADLIVVPCSHNKKLFRQYTDVPIEVCLEGVDVDLFTFKEREFPKYRPFTFLWFGASNERKGYKHMIVAWHEFNIKNPELHDKVRLVMKTTQNSDNLERIVGYENGKPVLEKLAQERIVVADNAVVDTRRLPVTREGDLPGLVDVYHDAHAFVFPSMGEGFGLTLAEAMSTGLPCIFTPWSGPRDFADKKTGYPLKFHLAPITAYTPTLNEASGQVEYVKELEAMSASPHIDHIVRRMQQVYYDYDTAIKKGRAAAERIRDGLTWDVSAENFIRIVDKHYKEWGEKNGR